MLPGQNSNKSLYIMKAMKSIAKVIVTVLLVISFCGMMCEAETAALQLIISGASMAVFYLCCKAMVKLHNLNTK